MVKKKDHREHDELYYFGYFKKLYESWEESTNVMMDIWINSPYMERAVDKSTEFKSYIQNFIENTIENRCEPKKKDADKMSEYIDSLEEKIRDLEGKVKTLEAKDTKQTPGRRKKIKTTGTKETKK